MMKPPLYLFPQDLTTNFFQSGPLAVPLKSRNPTVLGQVGQIQKSVLPKCCIVLTHSHTSSTNRPPSTAELLLVAFYSQSQVLENNLAVMKLRKDSKIQEDTKEYS